jgi:hypothetical protein
MACAGSAMFALPLGCGLCRIEIPGATAQGAKATEIGMMHTYRVGIGLLGLILLMPGSGWPHAYLVKSSPARRTGLSRAPA